MAFADQFTDQIDFRLGLDKADLYQRIQDFPLDTIDAVYPLSRRLSWENRWTLHYAQQVIEEYKKFVFLAVVAGHPVTPSESIDQVWHLHLIYTRSYWDDFCPNVLGRSLHHGPTKGGQQENEKYLDWYGKTLDSYERFFGYPAPIDIWSSPDRRFGKDLQVKRVNVQQNWVIPKDWIRTVRQVSFQHGFKKLFQSVSFHHVRLLGMSFDRQILWMISAFMMSLTLAGCSAIVNPLSINGSDFLGFYAQLIAFGLILGYFWRWFSRVNSWTSSRIETAELTPYEVAYLVGSNRRVIDLAVTSLVKANLIKVSADRKLIPVPKASLPTQIDSIERSIFQRIGSGKTLHQIQNSSFQNINTLQSDLIYRNLVLTEKSANNIHAVTRAITWSVLILGVIQFGNGLLNGRPVGYLIGMMIVFLMLACGLWVKPKVTRECDRRIKLEQENYRSRFRIGVSHSLLMGFALYGVTRLKADRALADLTFIMTSPSSSSSSGNNSGNNSGSDFGSDSGDDSGGDSGCGGCGGCGE